MAHWEVVGQIFSEDQVLLLSFSLPMFMLLSFSLPMFMPNDIFETQEPVCLSAIEENSQLDIFQCSDQCEYLVTSIPIAFEGRVKVRVNPAVAHAEQCIEANCWREKDALNTVRVEACDAGDHGWFWLRAFRH